MPLLNMSIPLPWPFAVVALEPGEVLPGWEILAVLFGGILGILFIGLVGSGCVLIGGRFSWLPGVVLAFLLARRSLWCCADLMALYFG